MFGVWGGRGPESRLDHRTWPSVCPGIAFQAHGLVYHLTLGSRVIKKKRREVSRLLGDESFKVWVLKTMVKGQELRGWV